MKKILLTITAIAIVQFSYAQWTSGSGKIYPLTLSDKVGIGTNNPGAILETSIYSASSVADGLLLRNTDGSAGSGVSITYHPGSTNAPRTRLGMFINSIGQGEFALYTGVGTTLGLYQNYFGNVGIGTISPGYKLDVQGAVSAGISGLGTTAAQLTNQSNVNGVGGASYVGGFRWYTYSATGTPYDYPNFGYALRAYDVTTGESGNLLYVKGNGNVGIGTTTPDEKLTVKGNIHAAEVKVEALSAIPDYVFESDYKLQDLHEVKNYIDKNHHLPEIPSAAQIEKDGISLGDMNMKLLKKVEELTLYILQQNERINKLEEALKPNPSK